MSLVSVLVSRYSFRMPAQPTPPRSPRLVEKGGLGLVMWNLARRGLDFALTGEGSEHGDIWIRMPDGEIVPVEVKTCTRRAWHIRLDQTQRVKAFILVDLDDRDTWVVPAEQMLEIARNTAAKLSDNVRIVKASDLPPMEHGRWKELLGAEPGKRKWIKPVRTPAPVPVAAQGVKIVRKTLASGEVRLYQYDRATMRSLGWRKAETVVSNR